MLFLAAIGSVIWMPLLYIILRIAHLFERPLRAFGSLSLLAVALLVVLWFQLPDCSGLRESDFFECQENGMVVGVGQFAVILSVFLVGIAAIVDCLWNGAQ